MIRDRLTQKCTASLAQLQFGFLGQAALFQTHVRCPAPSGLRILITELTLRDYFPNLPQAQGKLMLNICNQEIENVRKTW